MKAKKSKVSRSISTSNIDNKTIKKSDKLTSVELYNMFIRKQGQRVLTKEEFEKMIKKDEDTHN